MPWWEPLRSRREPERASRPSPAAPTPAGRHRLRIDFLARATRRARSTVTGRGHASRTSTGRPGPATATLLVHPADALRRPEERAALRAARASRCASQAIVTDLDGTRGAPAARSSLRAERLDWKQAGRASGRRRRSDAPGLRARLGGRGACAARSRRRRAATYRVTAQRRPTTRRPAERERSCGSGSRAGSSRRAARWSRRRSRWSPTRRSTARARPPRSWCWRRSRRPRAC